MSINYNGKDVSIQYAYCLCVNKENPFEGNKKNRTTRIVIPFPCVLSHNKEFVQPLSKDLLRVLKKKIQVRGPGAYSTSRELKIFDSFDEMKASYLLDRESAYELMQSKITEYQKASGEIYHGLNDL